MVVGCLLSFFVGAFVGVMGVFIVGMAMANGNDRENEDKEQMEYTTRLRNEGY